MSHLSANRQTLRKEGTQSHGTHEVSRATERQDMDMDQRGPLGPYDSAEAELTRIEQQAGPGAGRLQAWARIASNGAAQLDFVPTQRNYAGLP